MTRPGTPRPLVLVVYYQTKSTVRATVSEHLSSFGRCADAEVHYLNAAFGVPGWATRVPFDLVLFHYTFLATKWDPVHFRRMRERCAPLRGMEAARAAFPQDEYVYSTAVCEFLEEYGVRAVFSVAPPADRERIYAPVRGRLDVLETVLTGYVDERTRARLARRRRPAAARRLDIAYRGRRVPYWLGRRAQVKWQIAEPVRRAAEERGLRADISCAPEAELRGDDWHGFLLDSRVALGCEGGASLLDPAGEIRRAVEAYVAARPEAGFDEVEAACFRGADDTLDLFVLSPRQLEYCLTRTCQVLVEGRYSGVLEPGRHYIPLRPDLSNLADVLDQVADVSHCERIAEQAFADVIASGRYEYRGFVRGCLDRLRPLLPRESPPGAGRLARAALSAREPLTRAALAIRETALGLAGRPA